MPFTPFHMGPGLLLKAVLQSSFSLMVFGWTQIVMDVQPLVAMLTGVGKLHGFTHTFVGAVLIAILSALTGKYLAQWGLSLLRVTSSITIQWWVAFLSAFIGSFSHVLLDGIMHADVEPFWPLNAQNPWLQWVSVSALHKLCFYMGLGGAALYFVVSAVVTRRVLRVRGAP